MIEKLQKLISDTCPELDLHQQTRLAHEIRAAIESNYLLVPLSHSLALSLAASLSETLITQNKPHHF